MDTTRDEWAELRGRVGWVSDAQVASKRHEAVDDLVVRRTRHQHTRHQRARLPCVLERRHSQGSHHGVEIGVAEQDRGRFPAQFQRGRLELCSRLRGDVAARDR